MKNRRMHNWIICGLVILLAGSLAACQNNVPSKGAAPKDGAPTVSILTIGTCSKLAAARVSEAISRVTMERLGCKVTLCVLDSADYEERIDNLLMENNLADIVVCKNRETLNELLDGDYVYRLDRFLRGYPAFSQAVPDESRWAEAAVGEYCYGIPLGNSQNYCWGFLMRQDICLELGIDPEAIHSLEDLHQALLQVQEAYPNIVPVVPDCGNMETFVDYAPLSNDIGVLAPDGTVTGIESLEGFAEICGTMHQWYQEGLILKNAPFDTHSRTEWLDSGLAFGSFARISRYTTQELSYALGETVYWVPLGSPQTNSSAEDGFFCIYAYAQNVDLCMQLLELLYTDPQLLTMCVYGEEGTDYTLTEAGAAVPIEGTDIYHSWNWPLRNTIPQPFSVETEPEAPASATAGFVFEGSGLSGELYQCNAVMDEYYNALCSGMLDPETGLEIMKAELKNAHLEVILAEKQRQWTAWLERAK
ncbi:MAG: ABC transporter substrate-binding protein [Faecousia sp.]